ncbi:MAG: hypothetical protein QM674_01665 [Burkholderiaceae bacterium]
MNLPDIAAIEPFDEGVPFDLLAEVRRAAARFGLAPETTIRITARTHRETFLPVGERITMCGRRGEPRTTIAPAGPTDAGIRTVWLC